MNYLGPEELIYNNNSELGIHTGGFNVKSIMMREGISPIITVNTNQKGGDSDKVSDLFNDLVIPNWALTYHNKMIGGEYRGEYKKHKKNDEESSDDEVLDDDLHNKLLELVRENDIKNNKINESKKHKKTKKYLTSKKNNTRKHKKNVH